MARYTGPKNKIARREGQDLGLKTVGSNAQLSLQQRIAVPPGQQTRRFRPKTSDYGLRLREKQKAKRLYGLLEKQFSRYVAEAVSEKENTVNALVEKLERRLDNVVYRMDFSPTRAAARQLVSHGHVKVNGKRVNIPSYKVSVKDQIELDNKAQKIPAVLELANGQTTSLSGWLTKKEFSGKIETLPSQTDITEPVDWQYIIEFYTR